MRCLLQYRIGTLIYITTYQNIFMEHLSDAENNFNLFYGSTLLLLSKKMHKGMHINCLGNSYFSKEENIVLLCVL